MSNLVQTYTEFVASRAKRMGSLGADLHHAATGIMGEATELRLCLDRTHAKEELGDLAFYTMHYKLAWEWHGEAIPYNGPYSDLHAVLAFDNLVNAAGELLDLTKKVWAHNKPVDDAMRGKFANAQRRVAASLNSVHELLDYTQEQALLDNMRKLELRYPTGYSDAAAQQRADKPEGE